MALIGNGVRNHGSPIRVLGGNTAAAICTQRWISPGTTRGFPTTIQAPLAGRPDGVSHPTAWLLPRRAGAVAAYKTITGTGSLDGHAAAGINVSAALTGSGTLVGQGALIVSAVAALTGSGTLAGTVKGIAAVSVDLVGSGNLVGALKALGNAVAALTGSGALTGTAKGIGSVSADLTSQSGSELTAAQVAAAVWETVASTVNDTGTMGEALNAAHILARNKTITDPAAGTITVYDTDGTTVLFVADLFQDAAGAIPYAGSGAERRERLE